jgi:hypothetical protein
MGLEEDFHLEITAAILDALTVTLTTTGGLTATITAGGTQ